MKQNFTEMSIKKQDESRSVKFVVNKEAGVVVCRLYDRWYGLWHTAKTRCHDVDKFNEKKGRAIAFNKARKKELEFNLRCIEDERRMYNQMFNEELHRLDKRQHINTIYLAGVNEELADLMK